MTAQPGRNRPRKSPAESGYKLKRRTHKRIHFCLDSIAAAERWIYIENQYFSSHRIGQALKKRLAESDGPEIVLGLPEKTGGWLEQHTMDILRGRVLQSLRDAAHITETESWVATIEQHRQGPRTLAALSGDIPPEVDRGVPEVELLDPEKPVAPESFSITLSNPSISPWPTGIC